MTNENRSPGLGEAATQFLAKLPPKEREVFLSEHNLYVCAAEIRRIKQAIKDGRLWEHLQMRAHGHPSLLQALSRLKKYRDFIEKHDPAVKSSGLFFFDSTDLTRPELVRYEKRFAERYTPPKAENLLLLPQTRAKPFHKSRNFAGLAKRIRQKHGQLANMHACFYAAPFGIVPIELDEVYPLSQHETSLPLDNETLSYVASQVAQYILSTSYRKVTFLDDPQNWGDIVLKAVKKACLKKKIKLQNISTDEKQKPSLLTRLEESQKDK